MYRRFVRRWSILALLVASSTCVRQSEIVRAAIIARRPPADASSATDATASASDAPAHAIDDATLAASDASPSPSFETIETLTVAAAGQPSRLHAIELLERRRQSSTIRGSLDDLARRRELLGDWYTREQDACITMHVIANPDQTLRLELDATRNGAPVRVSYGLTLANDTGPRALELSNHDRLTIIPRHQELSFEQPRNGERYAIAVSRAVMLSGPTFTTLEPPPDAGRYVSRTAMRCLDVLQAVSYDRRTLRMVRGPSNIASYRDAPLVEWFRDRAACLTARDSGAKRFDCGAP